jgi:cytidylate kinase
MIITIDGPAGTGKSTTAKQVAHSLGYMLLDTGAMYRAVTYGILSNGVDHQNPEALALFLQEHPLKVTTRFGENHYLLDEVDVTPKLRSSEVTGLVSTIAAYPAVRQALVPLQRQVVNGLNAVCEGRDMGTVVFPQAKLKVYLTARPEIRAQRRFLELQNSGKLAPGETLDTVLTSIKQRDFLDSSREHSPLKAASDAVTIDTSDLSIREVVDQIITLSEERL